MPFFASVRFSTSTEFDKIERGTFIAHGMPTWFDERRHLECQHKNVEWGKNLHERQKPYLIPLNWNEDISNNFLFFKCIYHKQGNLLSVKYPLIPGKQEKKDRYFRFSRKKNFSACASQCLMKRTSKAKLRAKPVE